MKKIMFATLVLSLAYTVNAQEIPERKSDKPAMMERKKHHQGMDMKSLNLTEDQKAKFKTQNESFHQQMAELKKEDNITVKDWKAKEQAIRADHKNKTQSILTAEQKSQLEKNKSQGKDKFAEKGKDRGAKMKAELGLTDDQAAKMKANRQQMGDKMKAIRENNSLTDDQKKQQTKELMKAQKESMKSILTEDQMKKMKENHHQRPGGERKKPMDKETI